jgi:putative acetyltransferase
MQTAPGIGRFTSIAELSPSYTRTMGPAEMDEKPYTIEEITADLDVCRLAEARELLLEYGRFVIGQPGVTRFCFGTLEQEAEHLPLSYIEQGGGCLIAHVKHRAAGFVAWRQAPEPLARQAWELKRLWVRDQGRGIGLGRALTQAVLDRAQAANRSAVYLDTVPAAMSAAHRLYLEMGFVPCAPYNDNPVEGLAYLVKFL